MDLLKKKCVNFTYPFEKCASKIYE